MADAIGYLLWGRILFFVMTSGLSEPRKELVIDGGLTKIVALISAHVSQEFADRMLEEIAATQGCL